MINHVTKEFANTFLSGYKDYPNIHYTGSLEGMKKRYGWNPDKCVRIGNYIYNLEGYNS